MAERAILFSAPMIRALLDGRKTMTRRIVDPQPVSEGVKCFGESWAWKRSEKEKEWFSGVTADQLCKFGAQSGLSRFAAGDTLWVREAWRTLQKWDDLPPRLCMDDIDKVKYETGPDRNPLWAWGRYRHARFMPRWASRITLDVTDVKVERLKDITPADAIAEGIAPAANCFTIDCDTPNPRDGFRSLWNSIYGPDAWNANPWIVAVTFSRADTHAAHDAGVAEVGA